MSLTTKVQSVQRAIKVYYRGDNRAIRSLRRAEKSYARSQKEFDRALKSGIRENETPETRQARVDKSRDAVEASKLRLDQKDDRLREKILEYSAQIWGTDTKTTHKGNAR